MTKSFLGRRTTNSSQEPLGDVFGSLHLIKPCCCLQSKRCTNEHSQLEGDLAKGWWCGLAEVLHNNVFVSEADSEANLFVLLNYRVP